MRKDSLLLLVRSSGRLNLAHFAATFAACLGLFGVFAASARADFTVTRTDDPVPNGCTPQDCSLREAVIASNAGSSEDIALPPNTYTLSIAGPGGAEQGDLDITSSVFIKTLGPGNAVIDANGAVTGDRALEVNGPTVLLGIEIANGVAPADNDGIRRGGGVRVNQNKGFAMYGGALNGNQAGGTGGLGGGIYTEGAAQLLSFAEFPFDPPPVDYAGVTVQSNAASPGASGKGGGVYVGPSGYLFANSARIFNNDASSGGGVYTLTAENQGDTELENTYVSTNTAQGGGGALFAGPGGHLELTNTTLKGNAAGGSGGGLRSLGGTVKVHNATVAGNSASSGGGMSVNDDLTAEGIVRLHNTIVARNTDSAGPGVQPDCLDESGGFRSLGYNIIGAADGCGFPATTGDQTGTAAAPLDPGLALTTTFNGGLQLSWALEPGGSAVDAGDPNLDECGHGIDDDDARGVPVALGERCDIGAYQLVRCRDVIVNRVGTELADVAGSGKAPNIDPTAGADGVLGLAGADSLTGLQGADGLCGGDAADTLRGGEDDDRLEGARGADTLIGGPGVDMCIGGKGVDSARGCETERGIP
jgi:hypothetical protein